MIKHIPNFITSLNLASGFISIIFLFSGDTTTASWLIIAAMVFDFLDGFAARLLKAYSDIGKELDSLADVVSFGVAPGLIIYALLRENMSLPFIANSPHPGFYSAAILIIPVIFPVFAALRLAKFNIDTTQTTSFRGLPTPAAALSVASVVLAARYSDSLLIQHFTGSPAAITIFTLIVSALMVSRIPLLALKFKNAGIKGNEGRYFLIIVCAAIVLIFGFAGIPWIIPAYILVSLFPCFSEPHSPFFFRLFITSVCVRIDSS